MTQEDMPLEKALETIKQIAERFERVSKCSEVAERIDRTRADAIHAAQATGGAGSGNETL